MNKEMSKKGKSIAIILVFLILIAIAIVIVLYIKKQKNNEVNEPINENFSFLVDEESDELVNYDLYSNQRTIIDKLLKDYKANKYTIDNPKVVENPFEISPLTALIMFKTSKKEKVTMTLKGKNGDDIVTTFEASKDHYLPVYGLYQDFTNEITLESESGKKGTVTIKIDHVFDTASIDIIQNDIKNLNGEFYLTTGTIGHLNGAYDNYGEVRWFLTRDYARGFQMLQNGHLMFSDITIGKEESSGGGIVEIDLLGYVYHQYEFESGYHHDGVELDNENIIVLSTDADLRSFADVVYEIDRNTGKVVKEWDLWEIVSKVDPNYLGDGDAEWAWTNGIFFDKEHSELIISLRNRNSLIALDYETGNIKWIFGDIKYWSSKFEKYIVKGVGDDFVYPLGPHSPSITPDGHLAMFNNGYDAYNEQDSSCSLYKNSESYAMEYNFDREHLTAKLVYKYGGHEYFSYALSNYTYTHDNHKILNSGWHFKNESMYSDPNCTTMSTGDYDSYIMEFDENNNKIFEMRIEESKFKVLKVPFYNVESESVSKKEKSSASNYVFDKDTSYFSSLRTASYEAISEEEAMEYSNNTSSTTDFFLMNNVLELSAYLPYEMGGYLVAISPKGNAYKFTLKEPNSEQLYSADLNILPAGRYYLYLKVGDYNYNTLYHVIIKKS